MRRHNRLGLVGFAAVTAAVLAAAEKLGLNVIQACSIVGIGLSPSEV